MTTDQTISGLNPSTGRREDDRNTEAAELLHTWTSSGKGVLLTPAEIAEVKVRNAFGPDRSFSPDDVRDAEYHVRKSLNAAWRYEGGTNGQRVEYPVCLNPNDGQPESDCEWLVGIRLPDGSIARQKIGRFGVLRLAPNVVDSRGRLHTLELTTKSYTNASTGEITVRSYLNGSETTAHNLEGFVGGFNHPEDLEELFQSLRRAATTLRTLTAQSAYEPDFGSDDRTFRDRPQAPIGF